MKTKNKKNIRKKLAISEIILLITGIVAFSCLVGNFSIISAAEEGEKPAVTEKKGFPVEVLIPTLLPAPRPVWKILEASELAGSIDLGPAYYIPEPPPGFR